MVPFPLERKTKVIYMLLAFWQSVCNKVILLSTELIINVKFSWQTLLCCSHYDSRQRRVPAKGIFLAVWYTPLVHLKLLCLSPS